MSKKPPPPIPALYYKKGTMTKRRSLILDLLFRPWLIVTFFNDCFSCFGPSTEYGKVEFVSTLTENFGETGTVFIIVLEVMLAVGILVTGIVYGIENYRMENYKATTCLVTNSSLQYKENVPTSDWCEKSGVGSWHSHPPYVATWDVTYLAIPRNLQVKTAETIRSLAVQTKTTIVDWWSACIDLYPK